MTYRVRTTPRAEIDAEETHGWTAEHEGRPLEALRWLDGLEDAISSLREHPLRCPLAQEASFFEKEVRQLLFHRHRVLFVVDDKEVVVLHIRHGSRLPATAEDLREERK